VFFKRTAELAMLDSVLARQRRGELQLLYGRRAGKIALLGE
jgi:hypothetical protein